MMNCIIIEDQPPAQRILKKYIDDAGNMHLKGVFSDAVQALAFLKAAPVDLIFLDIHLPKISGIDFLKTLPNPPAIILTTAFSDYAIESYELDVVDYLLKPFSFQRFLKAIAKVPLKRIPMETGSQEPFKETFFIKSGNEHIQVHIDQILFIRSDADYTEVITPEKKYLSSDSLRDWIEQLDPDRFIRVHKSYIIHASRVKKIAGNQIFLPENHVIPIGRVYKEEFFKKFVD